MFNNLIGSPFGGSGLFWFNKLASIWNGWLLVILIVWSIVWKAIAMYRAGRYGQPWWFAVILIVNTFGILEIFYFYLFSHWTKKRA